MLDFLVFMVLLCMGVGALLLVSWCGEQAEVRQYRRRKATYSYTQARKPNRTYDFYRSRDTDYNSAYDYLPLWDGELRRPHGPMVPAPETVVDIPVAIRAPKPAIKGPITGSVPMEITPQAEHQDPAADDGFDSTSDGSADYCGGDGGDDD